MGRFLPALSSVVLALAMSGGLPVAASDAVFTGAWRSIDVFDGSSQYLLVAGEKSPHVTLIDVHASYCASHGAASTVMTGSGAGTITQDVLAVTMNRATCGSFAIDPAVFGGLHYTFQATTGTLVDTFGNTWQRLPAVDPSARTMSVGPFAVRWSSTNPEAITDLTWNGSANLTNSSLISSCPDSGLSEFWGNSWGTDGGSAFVAPVGSGGNGIWSRFGATAVEIVSAATGCFGTSGIPVWTRYGFIAGGPTVARIQVERRFEFGVTPFTLDLRPYIPRLSLANDYFQVLYPSGAGSLVSRNAMDCHFGCPVLDWDGSWFAIHDPRTGRGMVVRHEQSAATADLWIDVDAYSTSTASWVVLRAPAGGFTGTLVDRETLCLYDTAIWTPSMTPPPACTKPWAEPALAIGSKLGLPSSAASYTTSTKISRVGGYVTWRANLGLAGAGQKVAVLVATRSSDGTWTPFTRVTSRTADGSGAVTFTWRQTLPKVVSVRFSGAGFTTTASQARWR